MAEEKAKEEEKDEGKKGGNKLVIIIVAVVLVVLIIVGVVVMMLLGGDEGDTKKGGASATPVAQEAPAKKGAGVKRTADKVYTSVGPMFELKRFTVNLLTDSGRKYLRTTMTLELDSPDLTGELTQKTNAITDIVIGILTSKTYEEISTTKGKDRLKDEIVETLNQSLVDGQIKNVFFTEFVVQ